MTIRTQIGFALAAVLLLSGSVMADDVSGVDRILCSSVQTTLCSADGECTSGPPWNLNIPQFIEIDLKAKILGTTEASGENRTTPIKNIERADGLIFLQGAEQGRAFSFVVVEETGMVSIAVARDGVTVSVFGACTPASR